jgi:hypothetical protein
MKIIITISAVFILLFFIGCEQLKVPGEGTPAVQVAENPQNGLIINEICAKGEDENEFGKRSDWIEIYNSSNKAIRIGEGEWSITDNLDYPEKYVIPSVLVPAGSFLLLWCDGEDTYRDAIHTNFKLSGSGESIGLYQNGEQVEVISFGETYISGSSSGRKSDGAAEWVVFDSSSPGFSNRAMLSDNN